MTKILCVEDEVDIRQILMEELSDVGYEVLEAGDGREGLDVIIEENPDLVLCDITMPVMDGHSMLTALRDNHPDQADTPFIFLSALADREHILQGKSLGADDYLTKPVDIDMLIATIDSRLRQIARMTKRKEEQFVKLYRSFSQPVPENSDDPEASATSELNAKPSSATNSPDQQSTDRDSQDGHQSKTPVADPQEDGQSDQSLATQDGQKETPAPEDAANGAPAAPSAPSEETAEDKVHALLERADGHPFIAHAYVVGLDDIRQSLGPQWANQSPRIQEIARTTVQDHVSGSCGVELSSDEALLLFFESEDGMEALSDQDAIAAEFRNRLRREDCLDKRIKDRGALRLDCQTINLTAEEATSCADTVQLVLTRLSEPAPPTGDEEKAALAKELEACRIVQVPVISAKGAQTALTITRFDGRTQTAIAAADEAGHIDAETWCLIDCAKLAKVANLIDKTAQPSQPSLIVDIRYSTLENDEFLNRFQASCASLGRAIMGQLILNLRGIPQDTTNEAIAPLVEVLRANGCKVLIELTTHSFETLDPKSLRMSIVTGDCADFATDGQPGSQLKELIGQLHERKILMLMHNVQDTDAARHLFGVGVDLAALN